MVDEGFKRKLAAILSADAVGCSCVMGQDEEATVRTIKANRGVLTTVVQKHNGIVLDSRYEVPIDLDRVERQP